jgi:hypothetical protein
MSGAPATTAKLAQVWRGAWKLTGGVMLHVTKPGRL